jgi:hypothetical protein
MKFQEYLERRGSLNESNIASAQSTSVIGDIDLKIFELYLSFDDDDIYIDDYDVYEENESIEEAAGGEVTGKQGGLRTSKNPIARLFRWGNTGAAKKKLTKFYNKLLQELAKITMSELAIEIKKSEMSGIKGPEAEAKRKEFEAMLEKIKLQKERLAELKKQEVEKILKGGWPFGVNTEVLDQHIALLNNQEKLALVEIRLKNAKTLITDEKMKELKDQVKQLKARETKYNEELKAVEDGVKNSMEKDDYSDADNEVKHEKLAIEKKIDDVDTDIAEYREKMKSTDNENEREDYAKNIESLMKNKESYKKEMGELKKKAKKVVLGSAKSEE